MFISLFGIAIRLLGNGFVVDSQEASSLSHNWNTIDIYSNSWGPPDDGYTAMGPGPLAMEAFSQGANQVLYIVHIC